MGAFGSTRRALLAGVAVAMVAVACGSSTSTSNGADVGRGQLTGAGSTFDNPLFSKAFFDYNQKYPNVTVNYQSVGSGAGIQQFIQKTVDFGATDVPMGSSDITSAGGPDTLTQIPVTLGVVAIAYNVSGLSALKLDGPTLVAIFQGKITRWNDPAIVALNSGTTLPDKKITVAHRADGSGTSYIFTNYLSSIDPAWAAKVGTSKTPHWPVGEGAEGNGSVAATVYRTPFSIGYIEQAYSRGLLLPFAAIRNQAGNYVTPTTQAVAAAAAEKPHITATDFSIVNQPGASSYPSSGYSWALIYTHQPSQATGQKLVSMLDWLTHSGQAYAAANGYVPLPPQIQQLAHTMLQQVTGPNGQHLLG